MKRISDIRRKVMQIANRLHKAGATKAAALRKAWQILKTHKLVTKVVGTTYNNRQSVLARLAKFNPADVTINLVRDYSNAYDSNAVAVVAVVEGKAKAVIGYLSKVVASVVSILLDKGLDVTSNTFCLVGGEIDRPNYGARFIIQM